MKGGKSLFDAMLKKDNDPLSAAEIVEFPIPEAQYEETIRALNGIQSGAVVEQDCFVADIGTAGSVFLPPWGRKFRPRPSLPRVPESFGKGWQ